MPSVLLAVPLIPVSPIVVPVAPLMPGPSRVAVVSAHVVLPENVVVSRHMPVQPRVMVHPYAHAARGDGQQGDRERRRENFRLHLPISKVL